MLICYWDLILFDSYYLIVSGRDRDTAPFLYIEPPSEFEPQIKLMDRITPATEFLSHSDKYSSFICDNIYSRDFANDHHMHSQYTSLFCNLNDSNDFHKLNIVTTTNLDCKIEEADDEIASTDLNHSYMHHCITN